MGCFGFNCDDVMKIILDAEILFWFGLGAVFSFALMQLQASPQTTIASDEVNDGTNYTIPSSLAIYGNFNFIFSNRTYLMEMCNYPNLSIIGCMNKSNNNIVLAKDINRYTTWETCNHEVMHTLIAVNSKGTDWEHSFIEPLETHLAIPACFDLVAKRFKNEHKTNISG